MFDGGGCATCPVEHCETLTYRGSTCILSNIDTSSWDDVKKAKAKKAATDALKQFSEGVVVDGITRKVNRVSRREYTRSNYTEGLYSQSPDIFADKMRAAEVADDIVVATTNWQRDGGLKHPRSDNFVDFDHGKTLIASGNSKYTAEVVVGITDTGEAVFYDVVDMQPATFDIKKAESPTTATTQNAIGDIQGDSDATNVAQEGSNVKVKSSLSDSDSQAGDTPQKFGNYNVSGKDIALKATPVVEDIGPVADGDIAPVGEQAVPADPVGEEHDATSPKQEKMPRMAKATSEEQARAQILTDEPMVDNKKTSAWNLIKDNFVDRGTIFETLSLKTGNRELQAKFKSIGRAESSAQWFMEHGNASTSSLKSIRDTVEKSGKTQQFYEYLYHQHNVDRMNLAERYEDVENKPVFGYDVTSEMSKEEAAKLEKANPEFREWANEVYSYMTYLREMMVDSGVISHDTAKLWAEMYPHYVPVRRQGDDGLNINVALDTNRTGVNAPVKRATGGNRDILPLFDTMAMRTEQTFKAVARNRFGVELKNMLGSTIENEAVDIDEAIDSVETELLQEGKDGRNPTFTVFENGEKVTFEITDEMYDTMKPKSKAMGYTNKVLNTANNIRRGLLTEYNPAFMLTNPIKDPKEFGLFHL